ncbi:MAG: serine/threonine-protein kinase [Myxococcales bacterium]
MFGDARTELWGALLDGQYRLGEPVGTGATGVVLRAFRESDDREFVVKVLKESLAHRSDLALRLRREAEAARAIRHPGIVACVDDGTLPDGSPYLVFERLHGESLLRMIRRRGPLPVSQAIAVLRRATRVLSAVHAAGYVHRDLKSEHVWLSVDRGALHVSLLDFGVCQPPQADMTGALALQVLGTPGYLAPEQAAPTAPATPRSDLYGLGATLFEALTGRPPFAGLNAASVLRQALSEDAELVGRVRANVPRSLESLVQSLLARDPRARPLNTRLVERALAAAADTPLHHAENQLVAELMPAMVDPSLVQTLDESRPTRAPVPVRAAAF